AGPGIVGDRGGDITAIFTVLVAGSDMDEPVADMLRGVLDGHVVLDRAIAERGRFPAIDLRRSVSRSAPDAWTDAEADLCRRARAIVATYEEAAPLIRSGLYSPGSDAALDEAIRVYPAVDAFLGTARAGRSRAQVFAALASALTAGP
ncbi:MAG: flagellum-specific ATP synthase FliI, partial [Thermohalobaculum sp.]|nr:flagellum-specific ATP synthase FliI [Thermohalobaculum sp.]